MKKIVLMYLMLCAFGMVAQNKAKEKEVEIPINKYSNLITFKDYLRQYKSTLTNGYVGYGKILPFGENYGLNEAQGILQNRGGGVAGVQFGFAKLMFAEADLHFLHTFRFPMSDDKFIHISHFGANAGLGLNILPFGVKISRILQPFVSGGYTRNAFGFRSSEDTKNFALQMGVPEDYINKNTVIQGGYWKAGLKIHVGHLMFITQYQQTFLMTQGRNFGAWYVGIGGSLMN